MTTFSFPFYYTVYFHNLSMYCIVQSIRLTPQPTDLLYHKNHKIERKCSFSLIDQISSLFYKKTTLTDLSTAFMTILYMKCSKKHEKSPLSTELSTFDIYVI